MNYSSLLQDVLIPAGLKLGGYPDDVFINMSEKEREEFECQICYMVLKDARQCDNHHYFCAPCIFSWSIGHGENHDKCPVCRTDSAYKTCPEVDERLSRKRVKCVRPKCEWRGFLRDFRSHDHGLELVGGRSEEILPEIIAQLPQHRPPTPPSFFFGVPLIPSHDNMMAQAALGGHAVRYQQMRSHLEEGRDRLLALMLTFSEVLDMRRRNIVQFQNHRENNRVQQMQEVHHLGERLGDVATALMYLLEEARSDMSEMHSDFNNLPDSPAGLHTLLNSTSEASTAAQRTSPRTPLTINTSREGLQSLRAAFSPSLSLMSPRTSSFPLIGNMVPTSDVSSPRSVADGSNATDMRNSVEAGVNSQRFNDTASHIDSSSTNRVRSTLGTVSDRILESNPGSRTDTALSMLESDPGGDLEDEIPQLSTRASISRYRRRMLRRQLGERESSGLSLQRPPSQPLPHITSPVVPPDQSAVTPSASLQHSTQSSLVVNDNRRAVARNNIASGPSVEDSGSPERDWGTFTISSSSVVNDQGTNSLVTSSDVNESDQGNSRLVTTDSTTGHHVASSGVGTSTSMNHGRRVVAGASQLSDLTRADVNSLGSTVSGSSRASTSRQRDNVPSSLRQSNVNSESNSSTVLNTPASVLSRTNRSNNALTGASGSSIRRSSEVSGSNRQTNAVTENSENIGRSNRNLTDVPEIATVTNTSQLTSRIVHSRSTRQHANTRLPTSENTQARTNTDSHIGTQSRLLQRNREGNVGLLPRENTSSQDENSVSVRAAVRRPSAAGQVRSRPVASESSIANPSILPRRSEANPIMENLPRRLSHGGLGSNIARRSDREARASLAQRTNTDVNNSNNSPVIRRLSSDVPSTGTVTRRRGIGESSSRRLSLDMNPNPNRRTLIDPSNTVSRTSTRRRASNDSRATTRLNQNSSKSKNS